MSEQDKSTKNSVNQTLENLAYGHSKASKSLSDEIEESRDSSVLNESDRSLSSIHTGSRDLYDESLTRTQPDGEGLPEAEGTALSDAGALTAGPQPGIDGLAEVRGEEAILQGAPDDAALQENNAVPPIYIDAELESNLARTNLEFQETEPGDQQPNVNLENSKLEEIVAVHGEADETVDQAAYSVKLDDSHIDENSAVGDIVGTVSAIDPEGGALSYSLSNDAGGRFSIDEVTGEIKVAGALDHEASDNYSVTVDVSDGTNVTQQLFTINIGDVDEAAHSVSLDDNNIDENSAIGDVVGTVSAVDPESGSLSYSLSDDAGGNFTIDAATGEIKVAGSLDYESTDTYSVTVDVSDGTHVTQQIFTLNVTDVDEAAHSVSLDNNNIDENSAIGDVVGTVSAVDPESGSLSYSLSDDAGGNFTIDATTGEIKVAASLDYEASDSHSVTVDVSDGTNVTQQTFTLNVGDVDEAAHSISLDENNIDENSTVGDVVGTVSAVDPEGGTLSYSLSDDASGNFTIDASTGEIKVAANLDHEASDTHSVTVDVSDGTHVTQQVFTINVGDVDEAVHSVSLNDNNIDENSAVGDVVGTVSAVDPEGGALSYSLSDDGGGNFTIDASTGEIKVAGNLDYENTDTYSVTVDVSDGTHITQETFTLNVTDVNEAAHSITLDNNSIDENTATGTVVGTVSAEDPEGGSLSYSLSNTAGGRFSIDAATGEIKVAGNLDHEAYDSHTVTVDVSDGTNVTQQTFTIDIGDVDEAAHSVRINDNSIDENSALGDVVGTVTASDPEGGTLTYSLSDDAGGNFTIDASTGEIKVAGALDHEATDSYSVTVDVSDGTHVTQQTFTLNVGDVDEAAHSVSLDNNAVDENTAVGTVVGTVSAEDPEGGTLTYSLSDDASSMFAIDPFSGEISVAGDLNFEQSETHSITVEVSDGTHITQQTFTMNVGDVNEAAHSVELDESTINENASIGTVVGTVSAEDPEGSALSYSLSDDADGMFSIDASTGEIKVADTLDYETAANPTITVDISDGTNVTQQTFTIDVEDFNEAAHSISLDNNAVDENTAIGTVVGTVSSIDPEGGALFYSLSDDAGGKFSIDAATGEIKIAGALDHESSDSYSVTVDVNDGRNISQQVFNIDIGDIDEAAHSLKMADHSIDENSAPGTVVGSISAIDPEGGSLTYSLADDAGGMFTIDASTGEVRTTGAVDHETTDSYSVTVDVSDGTNVTQQTLTINVADVNEAVHSVVLDDNSIDENSAIGTVVGTVSGADPESGTLSYRLSDDADGSFSIDPFTGEITVAGALDHEGTDSYTVTVDVSDGTNITQQIFTINVGDVNEAAHSVVLDDNNIDGAAVVGDVVGTVSATDPENDSLSYALFDDAGGKFTIDASTGEIKVADALDPGSTDTYSVTVDVSDGTHVTQQTFTIDMANTDEAAHSVTLDDNIINEDAAVGDVVGTVSALDSDGDSLSYSLSDDAGGMFTIDASTGEIKVGGALDHETTDNYSVTVDVSDGTNITQQIFTIDIGDVNEAVHSISLDDNAIDENSAVGDVVGTVSSVDPEDGSVFYSLSDDAGGKFSIDPATGEIKVAGSLNHEAQDSYSVTVDVNDGKNISQQTFTLSVGDVDEAVHSVSIDDNSVDENAAIGTVVGTVSASDPESGSLSYSLSDDAGGLFTIDASTGEVKVAGALDHDSVSNHSVTVDVSDGTNVTQETFTIDVGDINEGVYSVSLDDSTVDENSAIGTLVGTVSATDPEGGTLSYRLTDDGDSKFSIDPFTGEITVAGKLNHEAHDSYSVTVEISDGTNITQQVFTIDIGDVDEAAQKVTLDDNAVGEDADIGDLVGTVSARDPESGSLSYSLSDDAGGQFTIDASTGEIKVADTLDYETAANPTITVDVSDGTNITQQTFTLSVGNINEAAHTVTLADNTVDENSAIGTVVGTVDAVDPEGGSLIYSLSDDAAGMFTIDASTGEIKTAGSLDHEATDSYSVTVDVSDGSNTTQQALTINVGDVDEAVHSISIDDNAVNEDAAIGDVVGTVSAVDPENGSLSYSLSDDAGGMFTVDASSGEIKVAGALDHENTDSYSVTVDVSDGTHVTQQTFTLNVGDVDEAVYSVSLDDNAVNEDAAIGDVVGTVSAVDPENGSLSYSLSDDAGGMFTVDASSGEIKVAGALDHENTSSYSVTVDVSDGTNVTQETFTLNVSDVEESTTFVGQGNAIAHENAGDTVDLSNMDAFPELNSGGDLEGRIGTETFEDMISDAEGLVVNHQSDATVTFQGEIAGYHNSIGAYQIDAEGNISDVQLLWGDASSDKLETGVSAVTYEGIEAGSSLGFFTIADGFSDLPSAAVSGDGNTISATGSWMFVSPDFDPNTDSPAGSSYNVNVDDGPPTLIFVEDNGTIHTQSGSVFHSLNQSEFNPEANVDDREHFIAGVDQENGVLNFGFEDLLGGGDVDFNDGMFSVQIDSRDLIDTPNPLFSEDANGQSTFQISDGDTTDLSGLVVTLGDIQAGDTLTVGGAYDLVGNEVFLPDGTSTGISVSFVDDGSTITATLSGAGSSANYEGIVQNLNFSNDSGADDISGYRDVSVVATDSDGDVTSNLVTVIEVSPDPADPDAVALDGAVIEGTSGNDVIFGSAGDDQITGGAGDDIFYFASDQGNDQFSGGDGGGWSDTIVLSDGMPTGDVNDWLSLDTGTVESNADGEVFLSEDAAGTITIGDVELTFEGVEKIEG